MTNESFALPSRRSLLASGAAIALSGCSGSLIGPPAAPQIYALHPIFSASTDAPKSSWQLLVAQPTAPEVLDTERIALERAPNIMDYYANAQWTDRLPLLLQSLLIEAFEKVGRSVAVGREATGLRADYVLTTDIRAFEAYYDVPDAAPKVRVELAAKLVAALSHDLAGTKHIQREEQAATNDLVNITATFGRVAGAALDELVNWVSRISLTRSSVGAR